MVPTPTVGTSRLPIFVVSTCSVFLLLKLSRNIFILDILDLSLFKRVLVDETNLDDEDCNVDKENASTSRSSTVKRATRAATALDVFMFVCNYL